MQGYINSRGEKYFLKAVCLTGKTRPLLLFSQAVYAQDAISIPMEYQVVETRNGTPVLRLRQESTRSV